ncbi:MAG: ChaN family lipoprotein [Bacteroidetes bacterium]|nr:ChaN family lipoprotein [Bacteroidota bacterium]
MKKLFLITCSTILFCIATIGFAQTAEKPQLSDKNYKIYSVKQNKEVTLDDIVNDMKDYDIVLFGEEHNDSVGHYMEMSLLEHLFAKYGSSVVLSMEMFERNVQPIVDEYLNGFIKESHFKKDAIAWSNYRDYRPMVEFSKAKGLKVMAANASMRYVSLANRKGVKELEKLSPEAKTWMAPLPYDTATGKYYEKLREIMGYNAANNHGDTSQAALAMLSMMPKSLAGHSLWDATMAYSISTVFAKTSTAKVLHLNGRFHSDDHFGVFQQLQKYAKGKKVLTISSVSDKEYPKIDFKSYSELADYIIFTDPNIPKTYKQ